MIQLLNNMSVFKRNKKYWIGFRLNRRRYRFPSPENSLAGARAYEIMYKSRLLKGEDIKEEREEIKEVPNFKKFSKQWFEVYVKTNNKKSEIKQKETVLRLHLVPFFGRILIDKINSFDIENFKAKKSKTNLCNKSINNHLMALSKCLKCAQEWGIISKTPKIRMLKVPPYKHNYLSEEECLMLTGNTKGLFRDMVLFALKTGLRFGEIIAVEWDDIDFSQKLLTVRKSIVLGEVGSPKSNKFRYIPLTDEVIEMLKERGNKEGYIFTEENNLALKPPYCAKKLWRLCDQAGVRRISWHVLRHTFASHLVQKGVSIKAVQELLGHSDIKTTLRYAHISTESLRQSIRVLEGNKNVLINFGHNLATIEKNEKKLMDN